MLYCVFVCHSSQEVAVPCKSELEDEELFLEIIAGNLVVSRLWVGSEIPLTALYPQLSDAQRIIILKSMLPPSPSHNFATLFLCVKWGENPSILSSES